MKAHANDRAGSRRRKALLDPNARILELMHSVSFFSQILGALLFVSAFCCLAFAVLVLVGSHAESATGPVLAVLVALIQLVLSRFAAGYARSMERYLTSGNQVRLVDLFLWQRTICLIFVGLVGTSLLAFLIGVIVLTSSLV